MELKTFTFIIRSHQGGHYEVPVRAGKETEARRLLKLILEALQSRDKLVSVKPPLIRSRMPVPGGNGGPRYRWIEKNVIYRDKTDSPPHL